MKSSHFYSQSNISELEMSCILLVERELDIFFSVHMKQAVVYSRMLADNLTLHGEKNFAEGVLSDCQVKECIESILSKVNMEIVKNMGYLHLSAVSIGSIEDYYVDLLGGTINSIEITQITSRICEDIIDLSISCILNKICWSSVVKEMLKKSISGKNILSKNNLANQKKKHQELIYNQIKGLLINVRVNLKNELIKAFIMSINNIENTLDARNLKSASF